MKLIGPITLTLALAALWPLSSTHAQADVNVPNGSTRKITMFSTISDSSTVNVASGGTLQVQWSDRIGALTGSGNVRVDLGKLTILGVNPGPFSGTITNRQSLLPTSTEFRNGASVLNAGITNQGVGSNVIFQSGVAEASTVWNNAAGSFARFENGALASNGSAFTNAAAFSFVEFNGSIADNVSISNNDALSFALFDNSWAQNGTFITNAGWGASAVFDGSTTESATLLNSGESTSVLFRDGSVAANGTTISNLGANSAAYFFSGSSAGGAGLCDETRQTGFAVMDIPVGVMIDNAGSQSRVLFNNATASLVNIINRGEGGQVKFENGAQAMNGTFITNSGAWSSTVFSDANALGVTITNEDGAGATTSFEGASTGTSETTVANGAGGLLDISGLNEGTLTLGRVFGDGDIQLGVNHLAIGSQNSVLDTIGGAISDRTASARVLFVPEQEFPSGGSLTKEGTGTVNLTGTSVIGGSVYVNEGTLAINGAFAAAGGFHVGENGILGGSGTVDGNVFNAGSVAPGNSPGVLTITGNLVQSAGGTLILEVGSNGPIGFDRVVVLGNAALNGVLRVVPLSPASYGDRIDFLQTSGSIAGRFKSVVISNSGWFRGRFFQPDSRTGSLVVAPSSYQLVAGSPNDNSLAGALNSWIGQDVGDIGVVTLALDHLRPEQYAAAFAAIEPGYYAGALNTQLETSQHLGRMLNLQLSSRRFQPRQGASGKAVMSGKGVLAPADREFDFWVQGSGLFSGGGLSLVPGAEFDSGNLLVGGGLALTPAVSVGFFADMGEGWTDTLHNGGLDYDRVFFGGYATYEANRFYALAAAGGGAVDFEIDRPIRFGTISRRATSRPESDEFLGMFTVGYEMEAGRLGWYLEPQASVQYSSAELRDFTETGAGALNLNIDDAAADSLRTYVGGRLARRYMLKSGAVLSPFLHAHWVHEHLRDGDFFHARLDGGNGPGFRYLMTDPAENSVYGGIGVNFWNPAGVNIYLDYNADWGRANTDHGVAVGVGKKF